MNKRVVALLTSHLLFLVAAPMLLPMILAIVDRQLRSAVAYGASAVATALTAGVLRYIGRKAPNVLHRKDALGVVALTWICLGVFGAVPFLLEGSIRHPASAVFEAVSGFTTTGATVVGDVDGLSRATNLWRCMIHWIGGMGIVVLFVAVFPQLGVGAKHLFRTEVPGPITEGLRPKIKQTALSLWWIYAALTALATGLLVVAGMPLYDAICHAFSTLGTGGFSTRGASVGAYNNASVDWIITGFMLLAGLNFGLFYSAIKGRPSELFTNYEVRFYMLVNVVAIGIVMWSIRDRHPDLLTALRFASFQTAAVTTTTGFMTEDFDTYPNVARFTLFLAMFMGACAGSTAGGIKASRVYALLKLVGKELRAVVQPSAVVAIRFGKTAVQASVLHEIAVYVTTFMLIFAASSLIMVALGLDLLSAMSSVVACLSSVGPGLGSVGPSMTYEPIPPIGKLVLTFCMIAGRLEIFALLAIFSPAVWRR
ncbi:MAG: TrkH family potassium uptake protein [Polyangiaceae bacterium]